MQKAQHEIYKTEARTMHTQNKFQKLAVLLIMGSLLGLSTLAVSESDVARAIYASAAKVPTNVTGIYTYAEPPKDFNPVTATDEELATYGLPPRPDKQVDPHHYALWERVVRAARIRWNGELKPLPGIEQTKRQVRRSPIPEAVHPQTGPNQFEILNASGVMLTNSVTKWGKASFDDIYAVISVPKAELPFDNEGCTASGYYDLNSAGLDGALGAGPGTTPDDAYFAGLQGGVLEVVGCSGNASYYAFTGFLVFNTEFNLNPGDVFYTEVKGYGPNTNGYVFVEDMTTLTYNAYSIPVSLMLGSTAEWTVNRWCCDGPNPDGAWPLPNTVHIFFDDGEAKNGNGVTFYPGSQASSTVVMTMMDDGGDQEIEGVYQGSGGYEGQHALFFYTTGCAYAGGCTP
jgi:hypothetical protein